MKRNKKIKMHAFCGDLNHDLNQTTLVCGHGSLLRFNVGFILFKQRCVALIKICG